MELLLISFDLNTIILFARRYNISAIPISSLDVLKADITRV